VASLLKTKKYLSGDGDALGTALEEVFKNVIAEPGLNWLLCEMRLPSVVSVRPAEVGAGTAGGEGAGLCAADCAAPLTAAEMDILRAFASGRKS
jgi:hypothetical protein